MTDKDQHLIHPGYSNDADLCKWLEDNSSGAYRMSAFAAERIRTLNKQLEIERQKSNSTPDTGRTTNGENHVEVVKSKDQIVFLCENWIASGYGDVCFWEPWPECPTPLLNLTPNGLLTLIDVE